MQVVSDERLSFLINRNGKQGMNNIGISIKINKATSLIFEIQRCITLRSSLKLKRRPAEGIKKDCLFSSLSIFYSKLYYTFSTCM